MSNNDESEKKSVLITGASTGIGFSTAIELDQRGYRVFAGVRNINDAKHLRAIASKQLMPIMLDVTDQDSINDALHVIENEVGEDGLYCLFNNAGINTNAPVEIHSKEGRELLFDVNYFGVVRMVKTFLPLIRLAQGRIMITSSIGGMIGQPMSAHYTASKHAVEGLADSLRMELSPWNIDVILIEPGSVRTEFFNKVRPAVEREFAQAPSEIAQLYEPVLEHLEEAIEQYEKFLTDPEMVAKKIADACDAKKPKARYLVTTDAKIFKRVKNVLPTRVFDKMLAGAMHINDIKPEFSNGKKNTMPTVLITGCSSGIGKATALQLDKLGYKIYAGVRTDKDVQMLLEEASDDLVPVLLDVTNLDQIQAVVELIDTETEGHGLDILINNAGISKANGAVEFVSIESAQNEIAVNYFGAVNVIQALIPLLRKAQGRIIINGAGLGRFALPLLGHYIASKFALEALEDALRIELSPWNIDVVLLECGVINTRLSNSFDIEIKQHFENASPEQQELYKNMVEKNSLNEMVEQQGAAVEQVVSTIEKIIKAKKPHPRYQVNTLSMLVIHGILPDKAFDNMIIKMTHINEKAA